MKSFFKEIKKQKEIWILLIFVSLFIVLRIPSLAEPYWYGDEGIYQVIGKALNSGRLLYQDIWDNKPPNLYLIYALFNGDQFLVRGFSLLVGVLSVITFFILGKIFFRKNISVYISTLLYVFLFGSPLIEGNIANAENFMHLPIILSAILVLKYKKTSNLKYIFLSGLLLSFAFMTKIVAVFEFSAFIVFLFALDNKENIKFRIKNLFSIKRIYDKAIFITGFSVLPILFSIVFLLLGAFPDFLSGVLSENIDYVGEGNNFIFPMSILFLKVIMLSLTVLFILKISKKVSQINLLIFLWLVFSLFSTFFSQRPYFHYILMSALPFAYFIGSIIESEKYRIIKLVCALIIMLTVYLNFGIYKKTLDYYANYIEFMFMNKKIEDYYAFFDPNTPRDYELARFIRMYSNENESVFLWSDSGQIYALSEVLPPGKYIVAYHIIYYNDALEYMVNQVSEIEPRYIIKTKESPEFRSFLPFYTLKYRIVGSDIYERQN